MKEAYQRAVNWVRDEVELRTCLADDDSQRYAEGFVTGYMAANTSQSVLKLEDPTLEAFWRGNLRAALSWERKIGGNV